MLMQRIVLFSTFTDGNQETIINQILPTEIHEKTIAYMPSEGIKGAHEYIKNWEDIAQKYECKFNVINNELKNQEEKDKLLASNILIISGGNTFKLLNNLKASGLDKTIKQFYQKPEFVLSGFSAGALVLTPTIKICSLPDFDDTDEEIDHWKEIRFTEVPDWLSLKSKKF